MMSFPSIRIEGGLLGPDVLDQATAGELAGQKPADFRVEGKLTDEIAAVFADARALWGVFQNRLARLSQEDAATTVTRDAWVIPFLGLLGYELNFNPRAYEVDGQSFAISHRAGKQEDAPPVHVVGVRQELGRLSPSGKPRLAPHSLVQEYLNRTEHTWGLVTNGSTLRVLRDSTFVRRQAYLEFDLVGMLEEQRFQDFSAFYRLVHRTRLPHGMADSGECLLERYYQQSVAQGGKVRDRLRDGVEEAITLLANGFLAHPSNVSLRQDIQEKRLGADTLYRQLLRLIYRFLFLLVSEERGLVSQDPTYRDYYGVMRLRRLLDRRSALTDDDDLWSGFRVLWSVFGKPELASLLSLAPLNGELFAHQTLDECSLTNRDLLGAFWHLAFYRDSETNAFRRVNYAALDVEEFGSVYESLLELHPALDDSRMGHPRFALIFGSERKTTGSYYTKPELVNQLILNALDPVVAERLGEAATPVEKQHALLAIRVIDPACGSGHFLLAAARRIARALARVRTTEEEPAPERVREALRDVISHCIYGVDKNPLAVDLCRVALWIESHGAGKPLNFLDHRIRPGDSLVGIFDLHTLSQPIPDAAYKPLAGDDKTVARGAAALNRDEARGHAPLGFGLTPGEMLSRGAARNSGVDAIPDDSPADIHRKKQAYEAARHDPEWRRQWQAANLWTAAFFAPLTSGAEDARQIPTTATVRTVLAGQPVDARTVSWADAAAVKNRFFHWPLEFPEVFAAGGFDIVLSNPPWEHVELKEQEFFASRDPVVSGARTKAERAKAIEKLRVSNPPLYEEYVSHLRTADASRLFLAESDRYPLSGRGRINTYAVFAELISCVLRSTGRAGFIVPLGLVTDDTTKLLFGDFIKHERLVALTGYENEEFIFPSVDHRVTFSTVVLGGTDARTPAADIGFFIRRFEQLRETHRFFQLSPRDFELLNPNTGNCPIFRTQADAELTKAIYRRVPVLLRERASDGNPWELSFSQGLFNMASDSHHFRVRDQLEAEGYRLQGNVFIGPLDRYLPLYEAKMLHQFDHRFSTYEDATQAQLNVGSLPRPRPEQKRDPTYAVLPDYWIRDEVVESALPHEPEPLHVALLVRDEDSVRSVLLLWLAGYLFAAGETAAAEQTLYRRDRFKVAREVEKTLKKYSGDNGARNLQRLFPLTADDAAKINSPVGNQFSFAEELVRRFSPRWLLGWRDITNQGNERTMISAAFPPVAVGHTFPLAFSPYSAKPVRLALLGNFNSFVFDYVARQKVGGTHITYGFLKQIAGLAPSAYDVLFLDGTLLDFIAPRVLELVYTANDMTPLARDCGYHGPPFQWDEGRRFTLRAELDAAFLYSYLGPSDDWQPAANETRENLACLRAHFPTPRHAAEHILNSFPIVRERDEERHNTYRTRDMIIALYDTFTAAHRAHREKRNPLGPLPELQNASLSSC